MSLDKITSYVILRWSAPPQLTVSEWADQNRVLSPESSAEPGQWRTERAEYQRGIMDALSDPLVETVVMMTSSQIGKTEMLGNCVGYYISQDPSPILVVMPTVEMGQTWSKDRLAPMLRDTECLRGLVKDVRSRDANNTVLHKVFPGGHITISGANSAASLASRPIRMVLCDEVDRFPVSAGTEGDPVNLAFKRATTFWNRKRVMTSTPTIKDYSRIEAAYEASDKRKYYVPCPVCNTYQVLKWGNVRWPQGEPDKSVIVCESCGKHLTDADKVKIIKSGEWRAEAPFKGIAGFWINEIYSPWVRLSEMVNNFLEAKKLPETLKVFVNTSLGETWEEKGETLKDDILYNRRETYGPKIPMWAGVITASVDVQDDRLEVLTVAWGKGEECWCMDWQAFHGNPAKKEIWDKLDEYLLKSWEHESGAVMKIVSCCVDTGGHHTRQAYMFVKPRQVRRVYAVKGAKDPGKPIVSRPTVSNLAKVKLFNLGVDTAKETIYARLKIEEFGDGYIHFPTQFDEEFFKQLTAEKIVTRYLKGFPKREWVKVRARNEALDLMVYNLAALALLNPNLPVLVDALVEHLKNPQAGEPVSPQATEIKPEPLKTSWHRRIRPSNGGWINRWR